MCVGIVVGVVFGMVLRVNYFASPVWVVFGAVLMVVGYLRPRCVMMMLAVVAGMVLAFGRIASELAGENYVRGLCGYEVVVSGVVEGDPETDENVTKLKLGDSRFGEEGMEAAGSIYVTMNENEELAREDKVTLSGKMSDGFGTYVGYMYRPRLVKWERPEPGSWLIKVRNWFAERVRMVVSEPEVRLGLSYLMGLKTGLPDELDENLRIVGLTHIVVASGTHLSIVVEVARKICGKLSRFAGVLLAGVFVVFFMAMVGWTPSIMRAGLMALLTLVAWYSGREVAAWRLILMVAAVTLMVEPGFVGNMGWQLSFASYAGIMMIGPRVTKFFYGAKRPGLIGGTVIATLSAMVMTLPIILYHYGMMSLVSVMANLLILPTLPWVMGLVFVAGAVVGLPGVPMVAGWCATKMLDYHMMVVGWFAGMREFVVEVPKYNNWMWGVYGIIGLGLLFASTKRLWYDKRYEKHN